MNVPTAVPTGWFSSMVLLDSEKSVTGRFVLLAYPITSATTCTAETLASSVMSDGQVAASPSQTGNSSPFEMFICGFMI